MLEELRARALQGHVLGDADVRRLKQAERMAAKGDPTARPRVLGYATIESSDLVDGQPFHDRRLPITRPGPAVPATGADGAATALAGLQLGEVVCSVASVGAGGAVTGAAPFGFSSVRPMSAGVRRPASATSRMARPSSAQQRPSSAAASRSVSVVARPQVLGSRPTSATAARPVSAGSARSSVYGQTYRPGASSIYNSTFGSSLAKGAPPSFGEGARAISKSTPVGFQYQARHRGC